MSDQIQYFAIMTKKNSPLSRKGADTFDIVRFPVKDGKPVEITPHLKLFVYYNPVRELWSVHEVVCGMEIGEGGKSEAEAIEVARKFLGEANEDFFFAQIAGVGSSMLRETISWDLALNLFFNLRKQNMGN